MTVGRTLVLKRRLNAEGAGQMASCIVAIALLNALLGCAPSGGIKITPVPADRSLVSSLVIRESAWVSEKVAIIDVDGVLENSEQGGFFDEGENPVSLMVEKLDACAKDPDVRAVVLRINSPGGTVTASDVLYEEVMRFKSLTRKPVVAVLMDVAASGGYYVACAADEIICHRTTITGSIGVVMQAVSFEGTLAKLGVKIDAIKSGGMKDAGSPWRDMAPEERQHFQAIVMTLFNRFVDVVAAGRPMLTRDQVVSIADGRVYTAEDALARKLVDRIGSVRDAIEAAKVRSGVKRANTVIFRRPMGWRPNVYAHTPGVAMDRAVEIVSQEIKRIWTRTPQFLYLWSLE